MCIGLESTCFWFLRQITEISFVAGFLKIERERDGQWITSKHLVLAGRSSPYHRGGKTSQPCSGERLLHLQRQQNPPMLRLSAWCARSSRLSRPSRTWRRRSAQVCTGLHYHRCHNITAPHSRVHWLPCSRTARSHHSSCVLVLRIGAAYWPLVRQQ